MGGSLSRKEGIEASAPRLHHMEISRPQMTVVTMCGSQLGIGGLLGTGASVPFRSHHAYTRGTQVTVSHRVAGCNSVLAAA